MRILLDVDGVLANFIDGCIESLKDAGLTHTPYNGVIDNWDIVSCLPKESGDFLEKIWRSPDWFLNLKPYEEALIGFEKIKDKGEIFFITSPAPGNKTWDWERRMWLNKYFDAEHHQVASVTSKHIVSGDIFVDDSIANITSWKSDKSNKNGTAILWKQPYNEKHKDESIIHTNCWDVVEYNISKRLKC